MPKALLFTDIHIGLKNDSLSRIGIAEYVCEKISERCRNENVDTIFFLGDLFHTRSSINVNTMNVAIDLVKKLSKTVNQMYLIIGNHDIYYKNTTDVNSIKMFESIKNCIVVSEPEEIMFGNKRILMCPWNSDISKFENGSYDFVFGHFDIKADFLIKTYYNMNKSSGMETDKIILDMIERDLANVSGLSEVSNALDGLSGNKGSSIKLKAEDIGDFISKARNGGTVFSGHIHGHKTFSIGKKTLMFIGSPYEQTFGEMGNKCGYVVIENDGTYSFEEIEGTPRHVILKNSDIERAGVENFDFSILNNNILKRVIDTKETREESVAILNKISSSKVYEELPPEYTVKTGKQEESVSEIDSSLIKISKIEYIKKYVDLMDVSRLKEKSIQKEKLLEIITSYIEKLSEAGDIEQ